MKTLVKLSAVIIDSDWTDAPRARSALHHEVAPGVFVHIGLGPAGLLIFRDKKQIAIPLEAIMELVYQHEPMIGAIEEPAPPPALPSPPAREI